MKLVQAMITGIKLNNKPYAYTLLKYSGFYTTYNLMDWNTNQRKLRNFFIINK